MSAVLALTLAAYAIAYGLLAHRLWRHRGVVQPRRAAAFALAVTAVGVALASPLDARAQAGSLVAHMVQHELLLNVAPVLALLGLDPRLAAPLSRAVGQIVARPAALRVLRRLAAPGLALGVYLGVVAAWHVPPVYAAAAASPALHAVEHASLLWAGLLFWFHLLRPLPSVRPLGARAQLAYLAAGTAGAALLAAVLAGAPDALYPVDVSAGVADQRLAAGVMMAIEMPLALGVAVTVLMRPAQHRRTRPGPLWLGT